MSWEQLAEMRDAGVDIQAHSATHQDLRKPYDKVTKRKLNPEEYTEWLNAEVAGSKATLEHKLGIRVNCFRGPVRLLQRPREGGDEAGGLRSGLYRLRPEADLRFAQRFVRPLHDRSEQTEGLRRPPSPSADRRVAGARRSRKSRSAASIRSRPTVRPRVPSR